MTLSCINKSIRPKKCQRSMTLTKSSCLNLIIQLHWDERWIAKSQSKWSTMSLWLTQIVVLLFLSKNKEWLGIKDLRGHKISAISWSYNHNHCKNNEIFWSQNRKMLHQIVLGRKQTKKLMCVVKKLKTRSAKCQWISMIKRTNSFWIFKATKIVNMIEESKVMQTKMRVNSS